MSDEQKNKMEKILAEIMNFCNIKVVCSECSLKALCENYPDSLCDSIEELIE